MSAHHFFADPGDISGGVAVLRGDEAHHAARSLRVATGERITVADGTGRIVTAVVRSVGGSVEADVVDERVVSRRRPVITLHQAVVKAEKLELVVEKAAEIGVSRVVPFVAERSIVRWDERKLSRARERLAAVARAASKQSGSPFMLEVGPFAGAPAVETPALVLHEQASMRLREALPADPPEALSLVVGPEGGLTPDEVGTLSDAGAQVVSLGERILRTETAGLVAAAVVAYTYGWLG